MNLSIGIVGLPNVGKSTLFKHLTKKEVNIANYPFATIDPNVGVVEVFDERLFKLAEMSESKKIIPAVIEFYDIAGLVEGANKGEGLGNQFLSHIREVSVIIHLVRCFVSDNIIHISESGVNPIRDIDVINTELILKDLETANKRLEKLSREAKTGDKMKIKELAILQKIQNSLDQQIWVKDLGEEILSENIIKELNFLTAKPQIFLLNGQENDIAESLKQKINFLKTDYLAIDLANPDLNSVEKLTQKAYEVLGLISFFTTGPDETRAWTIKKGTLAPQAAGVIHSDFESKFIRADIINWMELLEIGGWNEARQAGRLRSEGKNYVMKDGDVVVVKHS